MKQSSLLLFICFLMLASSSQATITCSKPKLNKPIEHGAMYHFKTVVTCELVGETINLKTLKNAYLDDIVKNDLQFKVHDQHNFDNKKGMTGYSLDVTEYYNSQSGAMAVRADIIIVDDQASNFYYELRSKSIIGENDAKYNKTSFSTTTLKILPNKSELTLIKEIDVEKPWYAPDAMFFNTVKSRLTDSICKAALLNASKICGKNVDALSK